MDVDSIIDLIETRPLTLLILALIAAIVWLSRRLQSRDKTISHLTRVIVNAHKEGANIDDSTQVMIGVRDDRRQGPR